MNSFSSDHARQLFEGLLPQLRRVECGNGDIDSARGFVVDVEGSDDRHRSAAAWLDGSLRARKAADGNASLDPSVVHFVALEAPIAGDTLGLGYRLVIGASIRVEASGTDGAFAAVATLVGLLAELDRRAESALPQAQIEDWPSFERRGFMLDVSRDRVPTMARLRDLIERLALWKFNELQLYIEHTFAYARHALVWHNSSPITAAEIQELDALCGARGIDLVPNQNSLGHWHRWLRLPEYKHLAECPDGVEHAFSLDHEPFSLCPTEDGSLELLEQLYDELLPNFSSQEFNVGLDETFDIGLGRSKELCAERGRGRVYLEFLKQVHARITARGKRMQFWGDVIVTCPELVPELPGDAIALEWGYEAGHPFEEHAARYAKSGLPFHVCPGTSSWQSMTGRVNNALLNTEEAARAGIAGGARGYLMTDWGDYGHWQPFALSWPGLAMGAVRAWSGTDETLKDLPSRLGAALFEDPESDTTRLLWRLGTVHERVGTRCFNGTPFFFLLKFIHEPVRSDRIPGLAPGGLAEAAIELESIALDARDVAEMAGKDS
ncbi:MAG: hexosaminidase, partial [Planctomycetota bacterium]